MRVVVNSTPLIALALVEQLELLRHLFDEIIIPVSVYEEIVQQGKGRPGADAVSRASWLQVRAPRREAALPPVLLGLDPGEMDVLLLAQELQADWVLIDEKLGRKTAEALGLRVKGTLGILLSAYRSRLLSRSKAESAIETLSRSSVRVSPRLVQWFKEQLACNDC